MQSTLIRWVNIAVALCLFGLIGSFYATGVFSSAIDSKQSVITGVWASSMSSMILLVTPSMIGGAIFLDSGEISTKSFKVRSLTAVSSFFFCGFAIAGNGIRYQSPWSIVIGVSLLGIPLGIFYLLCTELLTAWMPNNAGLAVGLGQAAFGLGTTVFSGLFSALTNWYGTYNAVWLSGFILGIPVILATFLVSWPECQMCDEEFSAQEMGYTSLSSHPDDCEILGEKLPLAVLSSSSSFFLYIVIVFCSQTGFAMVPFFFDMGTSFGSELDNVILLFQIANIVGTLARLLGGILADFLSIPTGNNGAKTLMSVLLGLQALAFLSLGIATNFKNSFWVFILASIVLFVTFSGGACISAVLPRQLFGSENAATVYGCGGGIAMGCGESSASFLVANLISRGAKSPIKFRTSFFILALISFVGFVSAKCVRKSKEAFWSSDKNISFKSKESFPVVPKK